MVAAKLVVMRQPLAVWPAVGRAPADVTGTLPVMVWLLLVMLAPPPPNARSPALHCTVKVVWLAALTPVRTTRLEMLPGSPLTPCGPWAPVAPVAPAAPAEPAGPCGPITPVAPVGPAGPW